MSRTGTDVMVKEEPIDYTEDNILYGDAYGRNSSGKKHNNYKQRRNFDQRGNYDNKGNYGGEI